jgi:plasmid stability protein
LSAGAALSRRSRRGRIARVGAGEQAAAGWKSGGGIAIIVIADRGPAVAQVLIRNVEDSVIEQYRARARAKGRPLEAELREALTAQLRQDREAVLAEFDALRALSRPWQPGEMTTTEMIREDRDTR